MAKNTIFTLSVHENIAELVFDMPDKKVNTFTTPAMNELRSHLESLKERKDVKALVIKSAKTGTFIAGADIFELRKLESTESAEETSRAGQDVFNLLEDIPIPTFALINGACLGGGLELALACDYRITTDNPKTRLGFPETQLGIVPGWGGTYRFPRTVGLQQSVKMVLTGKPVDGKKALKIGLADACFPEAFHESWASDFVAAHLSRRRRRKRKAGSIGAWFLERTPAGRKLLFDRARKDLMAKTGGHYPAPLRALRLLRSAVSSNRERALRHERRTLAHLAVTPVCKNLIDLYLARESVKSSSYVKPKKPMALRRAAVLGAGVMGGRISWLLSNNDVDVTMKDIDWDQIARGYEQANRVYTGLVSRHRLDKRVAGLRMHRIHGALEYQLLGRPDLVIEAVVERMDVKKNVLAEVEQWLRPDTILATNTSALSVSELAESLKQPERFVGMHFFNPVNRMPLVEIIAGKQSKPEVVRNAAMHALHLGKTPVVVHDGPGFLVNRLLMPYLNEAVHMAEEGVDYERVDNLVTAFGMPMGPFVLLDEVGIDVAREVAQTLNAAFPDRLEESPLFDLLSDHPELLGKKSGKGFYLHGKKREVNPAMRALVAKAGRKKKRAKKGTEDDDVVHRPLMMMINEAAYALEAGIVSSPRDVDLALILGTGFPPFRGGILRYADQMGVREVVKRLTAYQKRYGSRYTPAPLITRISGEGKSFYDLEEQSTIE